MCLQTVEMRRYYCNMRTNHKEVIQGCAIALNGSTYSPFTLTECVNDVTNCHVSFVFIKFFLVIPGLL